MLLALHNAFVAGRVNGSAMDYLLPRFVRDLQGDFCRFVDGGAGIGHTGLAYRRVLLEALHDANHGAARVVCYEPLSENFREMSGRLAAMPEFVLRQAAVTNTRGKTSFAVPSRLSGDNEHWSNGTSYNGFVVAQGQSSGGAETIEVDTVRLADDLDGRADFIKLDLQGGELEAIKGLDDLLETTRVLYIEAQMMGHEEACSYLAQRGFLVMLDRFQFGLRPNAVQAPLAGLKELGVVIDQMYLPSSSGMPLIFWGYMDGGRERFDGYRFSAETTERMRDLGIDYFQSDAICINTRFLNDMVEALHGLV